VRHVYVSSSAAFDKLRQRDDSGSATDSAAALRRWLSLSKPPPPDMRVVYFGEQTAIRSAILRRGKLRMKLGL